MMINCKAFNVEGLRKLREISVITTTFRPRQQTGISVNEITFLIPSAYPLKGFSGHRHRGRFGIGAVSLSFK
jgi:hypothetical protein